MVVAKKEDDDDEGGERRGEEKRRSRTIYTRTVAHCNLGNGIQNK